ncbi:hypothetical protein L914_10127 [Phytophthora nicotianae]|uniref:FLYWCH-type domain-containing protein n=1 Tax=Phytophthora nicotianae TaxID=4792 RepID=W2N7Y1_PHYNI|nr:hypothetical protein L914_10127 [Phytophthora nicotianae]
MARQHTSTRPKQKRANNHKVRTGTGHGAECQHTTLLPDAISYTSTSDDITADCNTQFPSTQSQPALRVKKTRGSKTVKIYKGFRYTKSWASTKNIVYRCSTYRTSRCGGVLKITPHCEWSVVGDLNCRDDEIVNGSLTNETVAMKKMTDRLATEDPGMPEEVIWERFCAEFL